MGSTLRLESKNKQRRKRYTSGRMLEAGDEQQFLYETVADDGFSPASRKEHLAVHLLRHFLKNFMRRMIIIQVTTSCAMHRPSRLSACAHN